VPSYSSTEKGLEVDGISREDGPAAKAGIIKGDVIKAINQKPVNDIYEYMDRLSTLKKGVSVPVLIKREDKEIVLEVTF
jgi:S1-C subfamily serine protease